MNDIKNILILGLPGAGKSELSSGLRKMGWDVISAGNVVRELALEKGIGSSREELQSFGANLLATRGYEYFSSLIIAKLNKEKPTVIEGVRPISVINLLRLKIPNLKIVYVEATRAIRLGRLLKRDGIGYEDFYKLEENPLENEIILAKKLADVVINNDGSIQESISKILNSI